MTPAWRLETRRGTVHELHHADWPEPLSPTVWLLEPTDAAIVLGSTQRPDLLDAAAVERAGLAVVQRRSGGGALLVVPGETVWIDVFVPRGHRAWRDDVHAGAVVIGRAWLDALAATGEARAELDVHPTGVVDRVAGSVACFATLGPGEVTRAGAKLVGLSQRRTRPGARVQGLVHVGPGAVELVALLADPRAPGLEALGGIARLAPKPVATVGAELAAALLDALAASSGPT